MLVVEMIKSLAASTRAWRERVLRSLQETGCNDLSYRPRTGMSSIGWLLAHQAAAYDYTLNMLIGGKPPKNPDLFYSYRGDSSDKGDWKGTSIQEINNYFDSAEKDFLTWFEQASEEQLKHILEGTNIPQYYQGMRVIDAIADTFVHLNHHNGHLSAIKGDWYQREDE
ncbi:MAG: DinB family protein [Candidatus Bathyarchaeota archaeon]|nr:DinB family protein [Candidatus Bathyarchaeota archaeon]